MKTYIIDWGEKSNGGRYALIQARSKEDAFWEADSVGDPSDAKIEEFKIPKDWEGGRYMEIESPKDPYCGPLLSEIKWKKPPKPPVPEVEPGFKLCSGCKTVKEIAEFNKDSAKQDKLQTQCRDCKRAAQGSDYDKKKAIYAERQKAKRAANPTHKPAHEAVRRAIKKGTLTRPTSCTKCGNSKQRIEAHHHNGYEKESWLDVIFLCTSCHRTADA